MDAALGPPEKMVAREDDLTPMMAQYFELCRQYEESLVLFQVGDFYEAFCEAAETVSRLCEITLTKREDSTGEYAMAGIPIDNAETYIERLLDAGYRVAVADQVEDPDAVSGVVERAVTRIVTPGTLTEDELLAGEDNNFVACLATAGVAGPGEGPTDPGDPADPATFGLAVLDVSTGDFYATGATDLAVVADEIGRFDPAEAIVGPAVPSGLADDVFPGDCMVSPYERRAFAPDHARERIRVYFGSPETLLAGDAEIRACGALLSYAEYTRGGGRLREPGVDADGHVPDDSQSADSGTAADRRLDYLTHLTRYDPREYMLLDPVAMDSLELFERRSVHGVEGAALIDVLDETSCALGSRRLTEWLRRPLIDRDRIETRLDAVEEFTARVRDRERTSDLLRDVYDVERLVSRVSRARATARDLRSLKATLDVVPEIEAAMADCESDPLVGLREDLDDLADVRELIGRAIRTDPPTELTEGGLIRPGYSDELDDLRETERSGKEWVDALEADERERTGIDSLKVGYNAVHGYYIEVTDANLERVPDDYTRRQTLKNSERYYTPELKQREDEIVRAEQRADDLEYELFREVRDRVAAEAERIQALADRLARLDALVALATVAANHDYVRPTIVEDGIAVEAGRHPVVERTEDAFVPNDARLDCEQRVAIVTGPNMSGKSTYMRKVALIVVMAQMGSFVPAAAAEVGIVDRVFTRVGASDDIAGGKSTFMVEMTELATVLEEATDRSLVLLDEVGRGTATTDGLAIARAITEYLHDEVSAMTLFATHHHELTGMADRLSGAFNLHFAATRTDDGVVFDHEIARGTATASYGVEVAKAAGVPEAVVERSREYLDAGGTEAGRDAAGGGQTTTTPSPAESDIAPEGADDAVRANGHRTLEDYGGGAPTDDDRSVPDPYRSIAAELREVSIASTTPLEALQTLDRLQQKLEE